MGILEKIKEIEAEMARTQKNKATEYHLGLLKAKLAKLRRQLMDGNAASKAGTGEGFDVMKSGNARVAMIGFPSVGKSTLLTKLTRTESHAAAYEFTTLTCIPGVLEHRDAEIQILDLPGIIEGAAGGKGRGRQVIGVARTADAIMMVLDASKGEIQKQLLIRELESVGIRLNKERPQIVLRRKATGGIIFNSMVKCTKMDDKLCYRILHEYKIHNAEVLFRGDYGADELIDVIEGNRVYLNCLFVYNKIDTITLEDVDKVARRPHSVVVSCEWDLNLDFLKEQIWDHLQLVRVYTKKPGSHPDFTQPVIMRTGATIEHVCHSIHRTLATDFRYAMVWGQSAKHMPQRVGLHHHVCDEDVVQIVKR